jgi:hypothetical protein
MNRLRHALVLLAPALGLLAACSGSGSNIPLDALVPGDGGTDATVAPDVTPDLPPPPADRPTPDGVVPGDGPLPDGTADGGPDAGPSPSPGGIYLNEFSGGFSGSEWFEVVSLGAPGQYSLTDIFGGGFSGTIGSDGTITLDQNVGSGAFSGPDAFEIQPNLGGSQFTFSCTRAPFTTPDFQLRATTPVTGDAALAGTFSSTTSFHDPATGAEQSSGTEVVVLTIEQGNLRITDPQGLYFQGPFAAADRAVFRVSDGADGDFATFPGSEENVGQDLLGEVTFTGTDAFTGTFLLQSRAQLGQQQQAVVRFEATRQ